MAAALSPDAALRQGCRYFRAFEPAPAQLRTGTLTIHSKGGSLKRVPVVRRHRQTRTAALRMRAAGLPACAIAACLRLDRAVLERVLVTDPWAALVRRARTQVELDLAA